MIIGSYAIKNIFPNFKRNPKDVDYISKIHLLENNLLRFEKLENPILEEYYNYNLPKFIGMDELYTLKLSHSFWDLPNNSWQKHVFDINFLKENGCKFIPILFWKLFNYWEIIHGKRKSSNLSMTSEEFFNNKISYQFKHDDLHEILVQHPYFNGTYPTYKKLLKEGEEVDVCMEKFDNLSYVDKFNVVFEEVAVMSIENRFPKEMYWKEKYSKMLKKFIISHCKIEEGIWILQHHKELLCNIPFNYEEFLNLKLN